MAVRSAIRARGQRPEHWADIEPDRVAVVATDASMTYRDWNDRADCLADALARRRPWSTTVAMRLPPSTGWFTATLALAKLGWRQVNLAPDADLDEVRRVLGETSAAMLLADGTIDGVPTDVFDVRSLTSEGTAQPRYSRAEAPRVLYTSGTTGAPKGVLRERNGNADDERLREYQRDVADASPMRLHNRTLLTLPLHHGAGAGDAQRAHAMAGTVYVTDAFDPHAALRLIDGERITHWAASPWMLQQLMAMPFDALAGADVSSVEAISVSGSTLPERVRRWAGGYFGEGRLHEFYASTETGVVASMPPAEAPRKPGSCGRPHLHVEVRVVDDAGADVPVGQDGELFIRTPMTMSGYLGAGPLLADGYFRSGDTGHLDADGFVYVRGRASETLHIAGRHVFAADVERAVAQHPAVLDAAVVVRPGTDGPELVAFCEVAPDAELTPAALGSILAPLDPGDRPRRVVPLASLPRNSVGKVRKRDLIDLFGAERDAFVPASAPPATERAGGWCDRAALDHAWQLVRMEADADVVPEPERFRELALGWEQTREDLLAQLASGSYRPSPVRMVAVPKGPLIHRPLPLLEPVDRIVFTALAESMRPAMVPTLGDEVFGTSGVFVPALEWLDFERAARGLARAGTEVWVISTDVTAFAENIEPEILLADLRAAGVSAGHADELGRCLRALSTAGDGTRLFFGMPHDQAASALLSTFFLGTGDAALRRSGVQFVRMQDDIHLFSTSPVRLKQALAALEDALRRRRLVLSSGKTELITGAELATRLVPRARGAREMFDAAREAPSQRARELRYALARLARGDDPHAAEWAVDHVVEMPQFAASIQAYLRPLLPDRPELAARVLETLLACGPDVHPFTVLHLLRTLDAARPAGAALVPHAWRRTHDDQPFYVRQQAVRSIGRHGAADDAAELKTFADDPDLSRVARSAIRQLAARSAAMRTGEGGWAAG